MMRTLKYIFSFLILLTALGSQAQKQEWKGLSVGADLSRFLVPALDNTRFGWEVSGDMELLKDLYGVVELGSQTTRFSTVQYSYSANGAYTRVGADYNYMKHLDPESTDLLLVGLRYGFTTFVHEASSITIRDEVWGDYFAGQIDKKWLGANWMEVATGMRAHLFNNFYLGWSVRFRIKIWLQNYHNMQPFHIPGYGRAWNNSSVGFNYTLYYKIPLIKKKTLPKSESEP